MLAYSQPSWWQQDHDSVWFRPGDCPFRGCPDRSGLLVRPIGVGYSFDPGMPSVHANISIAW